MIGSCNFEINKFKKVMMNAFDMIDLENMLYFLGTEILHYGKEIIVHQLKYELELLKIFELMNFKPIIIFAKTNHKMDFDNYERDVDVTTFK